MKIFDEEIRKHLKELLEVERVNIVRGYITNISCRDERQVYCIGDWDSTNSIQWMPHETVCTPFYRVNENCIVYSKDKVSLITYKSFAIDNEDNITFIQDDISYIFKDMDRHLATNGRDHGYLQGYIRYWDVFTKDSTLYGITYLDEEYYQIDVKGKIITLPEYQARLCSKGKIPVDRKFLSFEGNKIYEHTIVTGETDRFGKYHEYSNYIGLESSILHKDGKEIIDIEFVDTKYKNDGYITKAPDFDIAMIITFSDETKRLLIRRTNGKKITSRYFKDLTLIETYLVHTKKQFEKETLENREKTWYDEMFDAYFAPGLDFEYTTDYDQGSFIVKNDGHMKSRSKGKI